MESAAEGGAGKRAFTVAENPITAEITAAIQRLQGGDRAGGRGDLAAIWSRIAPDADPVHECLLSHHMADAQDDLADELAWDLRALDAALRCTEAAAQRHQPPVSIAAFMPSLHVNLAEDYFKLGDLARSREHLASAQGFACELADDAYGQMILGGIARLARKLDADGGRSAEA